VDSRGALVGINSAIITRSGGNNGIGFAIEVDMVRNIAEKLIKHGSIERGYLGVSIGNLTKELRNLYKHEEGALILDITPDSPAEKAGLARGDLIIKVDDTSVKDAGDLKNAIGMQLPKSSVRLTYERDGDVRTATVELERQEGGSFGRNATLFEGLTLENLSETHRYRLRIPDDVSGVLISEVKPDSEAASQGLSAGDIIVQVEKTPIDSVKSLQRALKNGSGKYKRVYVYRSGRVFVVALK